MGIIFVTYWLALPFDMYHYTFSAPSRGAAILHFGPAGLNAASPNVAVSLAWAALSLFMAGQIL